MQSTRDLEVNHTAPEPALPSGDELAWEALCHEALSAHGGNRTAEAIVLWRRAAGLTGEFPAADPRRAASISNEAMAWALEDALDRAEETFRVAADAWNEARGWVETMQVRGTARSSLFHHRLEVRHRDSFGAHIRARYGRWIDGGLAATLFNHGVVLVSLDRDEEGRTQIARAIELREQASGATDPGLAFMLRTLAGLCPLETDADGYLDRAGAAMSDPSPDGLQRWQSGRPPQLDDVRRLLSAICLTAVFAEKDFL